MPISRTPLNKDRKEPSMFDPVDEDVLENKEQEGPTLQEMAERLAKMQEELEESRKQNYALMNTGAPLPEVQVVRPEKVKLPDPALDPDGYQAAVAQNIRAELEAENKNKSSVEDRAKTIQKRLDQIWSDFKDEHPELDDQDRIEFVSTKVLKRARDRGVDAEKFMFNTPGLFRDEVAKEYVRLFGEPEADEDEETIRKPRKGKKARRAVVEDDDEDDSVDDSRAAAIFGGSEVRGRGRKSKERDEGPDMIEDIHNMQRRMNII